MIEKPKHANPEVKFSRILLLAIQVKQMKTFKDSCAFEECSLYNSIHIYIALVQAHQLLI